MALRLVFLGRLADAAGGTEREVADAASLAELRAALDPALAAALSGPRIRVAVNGVIVTDPCSAALAPGDEVAFLPPVSGG